MSIATVAIWYSGIFLGFISQEIKGTENIFKGHIHIFAKRGVK